MKITNFDLVNIANMLEHFGGLKLPQRISYAITKNSMIISKEYKVYEAELKKIFSQYDTHLLRDDKDEIRYNSMGIPLIEAEYMTEFNEHISELLNIELNVEFYHIPDSVFEYDDISGKYDALSAKDIIALQNVLCEENE